MMSANKKNTLIAIALLLGSIILFTVMFQLYQQNKKQQETIDNRVMRYIENVCASIDICQVRIPDFTNFDWDTVCFVGSGATLDSEPNIIPAKLPEKYSFINAKIIFLLRGSIVLFEEIPLDIEFIPKGTVLFNTKKYCLAKNEALFSVKKEKDGGEGGYYSLFSKE